jgi:8-oxo-dGTP pyrophosphatase MutT (NUDIX family)
MNTTTTAKREYSAGGVVFRKFSISNFQFLNKFLLGRHSGYHKWVLPKGLIEAGETPGEAAVREVKEEMGVEGKIVRDEPLHVESYEYWAVMKQKPATRNQEPGEQPERRVKTYQENPAFDQVVMRQKVKKTVTWFLMEYVAGEAEDHSWEMEEPGWFTFEEALEKLAFEGERVALGIARDTISQ